LANTPFICNQQQLIKSLLSAVFIFSSFAFPGYTDTSSSDKQFLFQTELVCTHNNKYCRHTVLFKADKPKVFTSSFKNKVLVLLLCNNLIKVKLENSTALFYFIKTSHSFIALKIIPQNPVEDHLISTTV
jgi:hypothetical protein